MVLMMDKKEEESSSTDYDSDNVSEGDFDSEAESVSSRMSAETVDYEVHLADQNPISSASDEVDLSGFHDVCRKILAKQIPPGYNTGILCKLKYSSAADRVKLEKEKSKERKKVSKKKKTWENIARVKPEGVNPREKSLQGIARRGVIDFFNAIEKHQSELKRKLEDAGPTEFRKSKVIKEVKEQDVIDKLDAEKSKTKGKWNVLDKDLNAIGTGISDEDE